MQPDVREQRNARAAFFQTQLPLCVLVFAVALWVITFVRLGLVRQDRHATFGFDLGIYDQATWLVAFRGYRRIGAAIALLAFSWFIIATRVIIPWRNGVGPFYEQLFGDLGTSPTQVAFHLIAHPATAFRIATDTDRLEYYRMMLF